MSPPLSGRDIHSVTHVRNSEIKQLSPPLFAMLRDIDLIFGMWVYNDKLQIKFTFHSGPMIFGGVMHLDFEIWPNTFVFSCHHFFFAMLGDIDLIFGMRVYNHNFEIHSG